jgi:hypothetical protein
MTPVKDCNRGDSAVRGMSGQRGQLSADRAIQSHRFAQMAPLCGFRDIDAVGIGFAIPNSKSSLIRSRRTAMKFETLMLNSFFAACVTLCVSTLVAMLG